jgi:hypothetical protein
MSFFMNTNARTVWVDELKVEKRKGNDGQEYDAKSILFCVASNRPYSVVKKDSNGNPITENGQVVRERPSDFLLCKATGNVAQVIADHCSEKRADGSGKQISRHLSLYGHLETYKTLKPVKMDKVVNINGTNYKVEFDTKIEVDAQIFIVHDINDFLDSKPTSEAKANKVEETIKITAVSDSEATATTNTNVALNDNAKLVAPPVVPEGVALPEGGDTECPF